MSDPTANTSPKRAAKITYVTMAGFLFAFLQTGYFYQLQFWMTSDYPSYLTITLSWFVGNLAGLWLGKRSPARPITWLCGSVAAYYLVLVLLRAFPYSIGWLPIEGLLIAVSGLQAGHFFAVNRSLFSKAARLFFWENNGFVLGWIIGFAGYTWFGNHFHWFAPAITALFVGCFAPPSSRISITIPAPSRGA